MTNTHRVTTTAAVILSLAAVGAPAAGARPADYVPAGIQAPASVDSRPNKTMIPISWPYPYGGNPRPATAKRATGSQAAVRIQTRQSGFNWGDAGIGAAGGAALALLGLGGALVISHRRPRRAATPRP
jgi:hypothetical protein